MIESKHYKEDFFVGHDAGALSSAKVVLPIVWRIFKPGSVVDIGCGVGNWLKVWRDDLGVADIQGVEGPYISSSVLQIEKDRVLLTDLKNGVDLGKKFDLAMSLEVAEHLPESSADTFVDTLVGLSDVVLFSASVPGQVGTYHINEQYPEYWARKFALRGYVVLDFIRDQIWDKAQVEWWYQQNIFIYIKESTLSQYPELVSHRKEITDSSLRRIHPWLYDFNYQKVKKSETVMGYLRWRLYPLKLKLKNLFKS